MENIKKLSKENKKNPILEFFWFCSGANIDILRNCPTDHSKYFGIGGTILFTALMASFAGGYAFFTAFHNQILSVFFGIFWGLMIFNLDRYIVVTLGKGDGTPKITTGELLSALPRLLMAILIGFVIATPLELKLFEKEINVQVQEIIHDEQARLSMADSSVYSEVTELKNRKAELEARKDAINKGDYKTLQNQVTDQLTGEKNKIQNEINGLQNQLNTYYGELRQARNKADSTRAYQKINNVRGQITGKNSQINQKVNQIDNTRQEDVKIKGDEIAKVDNQIAEIDVRLKKLQNEIDKKNIEYESVASQYNGFMARIEAYERLQDKHTTLRIVGIFITLLFIFIEVAPVFFKLMTESGPYDDMYERVKHEVFVREKQKISDINDVINCDIEIGTKKNQNRLNAEIKANEELLNAIALAQAEIAKTAIEKWKEREMKKAIENPESFIQANTTGNQIT